MPSNTRSRRALVVRYLARFQGSANSFTFANFVKKQWHHDGLIVFIFPSRLGNFAEILLKGAFAWGF